jgi:hypothetical protein
MVNFFAVLPGVDNSIMSNYGKAWKLETAGKAELSGLIVVRLDKSIGVKTPLGHKGGGDCYRIGLYFLPKSYLRVGGLWV